MPNTISGRTVRVGVAMLLLAGGLAGAAGRPALAAAACTSGVPGDVNGDGYAEVAVGNPFGAERGGAVHIFYGQRSGLVVDSVGTARDDQRFSQSSPGVPGTGEKGDRFGYATAFGDFDDDGCADLAIGDIGEDQASGAVVVLYGSRSGVTTTGARSIRFVTLFPGANTAGAHFGSILAVGDLDHDGIDDLAVGAPSRNVAGHTAAGSVVLLYGSRHGLSGSGARPDLIDAERPGIPGTAGEYHQFGAAVAVGDFDGDGRDAVAIGAPVAATRGTVQTIERAGDGSIGGGPPISPATLGLTDLDPEYGDRFGQALAAGDVNNDGRDDLAVGLPNYGCRGCHGVGPGAVVLLRGGVGGLTGAGYQVWSQNSPGVTGVYEAEEDRFGSVLALGPLDADPYLDLAIGAPSGRITKGWEGSVTVLRGGASGLTTAGLGGVRYSQDTPGIPGSAETGDDFGGAVTVSFVQSRHQASLIIGAPGENAGSLIGAGQVHQLSISAAGPQPDGSRVFDLDTRGVKGVASEIGDFGRVLS